MAIFEKLYQIRNVLDDTDSLICILENAQNINKHIVCISNKIILCTV